MNKSELVKAENAGACGYNVGGNVMMNAKQNTDTERLDFSVQG